MKKFIALLLCCVLCLSLFACSKTPAETEQPTDHTHDENGDHVEETQPTDDNNDDHSDHQHVNYKGLTSGSTTLEDVEAVEGKAPNFSFEARGVTYYAYKNITFDTLEFSQVQFSFHEGYVRISCTRTAEEGLDEIYANWKQTMKDMFGDPSQISMDENNEAETVCRFSDHTGNYITLTKLNETTVQLCYYLVA